MIDVIVVGGGPCGLSAAMYCQEAGLQTLVLEKGCVVNSIFQYPTYMTFFSSAEMLEIGGMPFVSQNEKPTRKEALNYYRTVAGRKGLDIRTYEEVVEVEKVLGGGYVVHTRNMHGDAGRYETKKVVIATGYFDNPNRLGIPGEELPKVRHQFQEAHPYQGTKVVIIGGKNSAVDAAMELERVGADVTIVYRGGQLTNSVKPWVRPVFEGLLAKGKIKMLWNSRVTHITQRTVEIDQAREKLVLDNDFVLKLIGYHPDRDFLGTMGVEVNEETTAPIFDPETMETNVPGIYVAGVISAGREANEIFIENGRHHGALIVKHIVEQTK